MIADEKLEEKKNLRIKKESANEGPSFKESKFYISCSYLLLGIDFLFGKIGRVCLVSFDSSLVSIV